MCMSSGVCEQACERGFMSEAVSVCVFLLVCSLRVSVYVYMCVTAWFFSMVCNVWPCNRVRGLFGCACVRACLCCLH